jgi:hypothetical protein
MNLGADFFGGKKLADLWPISWPIYGRLAKCLISLGFEGLERKWV